MAEPRKFDGEAAPVADFATRHYSVPEIAEKWNLSPDTVIKIFEAEPGVLVIGGVPRPGKRSRYRTLRIPEPVLERVHARLSRSA